MARVYEDDCPTCDGEGFHNVKTGVVDPMYRIEEEVAEECSDCAGTGRYTDWSLPDWPNECLSIAS